MAHSGSPLFTLMASAKSEHSWITLLLQNFVQVLFICIKQLSKKIAFPFLPLRCIIVLWTFIKGNSILYFPQSEMKYGNANQVKTQKLISSSPTSAKYFYSTPRFHFRPSVSSVWTMSWESCEVPACRTNVWTPVILWPYAGEHPRSHNRGIVWLWV